MKYCWMCELHKDDSEFAPDGVACRECEDGNVVERLRTEPAYREGFLGGMKAAYGQYRYSNGTLPFLEWVLEIHGPAIWNELFQYKRSSHVVSLSGLTREDGRRMGGGL